MLPLDRFNSEWRKVSKIDRVSILELDEFVKAHYLKKRPGVCVLCLKMSVENRSVGMCVFSLPPRETEKRYGGKTLELARLYLLDEIPRNAETWLISQSVKAVKGTFPDVRFLVSYADPSAGHSGTIYKAGNWKSDGRTDQERKSPRCDYVGNDGKKYSRKGHVPDGVSVSRIPRVSKFRFVYELKAKGASKPAA